VDWARIGDGTRWHAFARTPPPRPGESGNYWGETQLAQALCRQGPGRHPTSSIILTPACRTCYGKTEPSSDSPFRVVSR
jgi:hypothetical protein